MTDTNGSKLVVVPGHRFNSPRLRLVSETYSLTLQVEEALS